jgi:hypothetical protein
LVLALAVPALAAKREPACLAKIRAELPGAVTTTTIKSRALGGKRLRFRRGDVMLVVDLAVLESTTKRFLKENGANRFPEETNLLRRFAKALATRDEVDGDPLVKSKREQSRLEYRLADVLEQGGFALSQPMSPANGKPPSPDTILRLEYSHHCGSLCGSGGRVFLTPSCQELLRVMDWIS